jgi:hypothetical protein
MTASASTAGSIDKAQIWRLTREKLRALNSIRPGSDQPAHQAAEEERDV